MAGPAGLLLVLSGQWSSLLGVVHQPGSSQLLAWSAVATLALAVCVLLLRSGVARVAGVTTHAARTAALRRRVRRVVVVPQCDPDARGRTRPRAPTSRRRAGGGVVAVHGR